MNYAQQGLANQQAISAALGVKLDRPDGPGPALNRSRQNRAMVADCTSIARQILDASTQGSVPVATNQLGAPHRDGLRGVLLDTTEGLEELYPLLTRIADAIGLG